MPEARDHFRLAAEGFRAVAFEWAAGSALSGQGGVALASGDIREAERRFDEATTALQGAGAWFLAPVRCFRAVLAVHRGKADETIALMREVVQDIGERAEQEARTRLGAEKFAKAFSAGRSASIDGLLNDIDAHSDVPRPSLNGPPE
jgi:hypothetical protein